MKRNKVNFYHWLINKLPKKIIYFCFIHVMVHGTTGKYASTKVPELTGMDALKRYVDDNKLED